MNGERVEIPERLVSLIGPQTTWEWPQILFGMIPRQYKMFVTACEMLLTGYSISRVSAECSVSYPTVSKLLRKLNAIHLQKKGEPILCLCGKPRFDHAGSCHEFNRHRTPRRKPFARPTVTDTQEPVLTDVDSRRTGPVTVLKRSTPRRKRKVTTATSEDHAPRFRHLKEREDVCSECHAVGFHYGNCASRFRR